MGTFKALDFYLGTGSTKKIGELQSASWSYKSNSEQVITADEAAETIGVVTSEATFEVFIPVGGTSTSMTDLMLNQETVNVAGVIDGQLRRVIGRIIEASGQSTTRSGTHTGRFMFRGGKPEAMGI